MCFKNLPVEFDERGQPFLRGGIPDPYTASVAPAGVPLQLSPGTGRRAGPAQRAHQVGGFRSGHARRGSVGASTPSPTSRSGGSLEARSVATLFRGYEVIMVGRDPRDAIYITSRACGVCGGVHSTCSALAIEMAIGCVPPPLGVLSATWRSRWSSSTTIRCTCTCWPGRITQPPSSGRPTRRSYARAKKTEAPHRRRPWLRERSATLMEDLNPLSGKLYVEALHMTRAGARSVRVDLRQVSASADHRPRRHELDDHSDRDERDVRPAGAILRLQQEDRRHLGRDHRVLLRGRTRLTRVGSAAPT